MAIQKLKPPPAPREAGRACIRHRPAPAVASELASTHRAAEAQSTTTADLADLVLLGDRPRERRAGASPAIASADDMQRRRLRAGRAE